MSISKDLLLAILSMDAYNRDYGAGITGLGGKGTKIGTATILDDSGVLKDENGDRIDEATGFYAVSYDIPGVGTVISYRGTDGANDVWNGWTSIAGVIPVQARLAAQFYNAVRASSDPGTKIILTGHSLGGALAGFVGSIHGEEAVMYDNMPFEAAATNAYELAASWDPFDIIVNYLAESIWTDYYNGLDAWAPTIGNNLSGFAVTGELLQPVRAVIGQTTPVDYLDSNGGLRPSFGGLVQLHSQALLTDLIWARDNDKTDWAGIGKPLWDAAFDQDVGKAAGFGNVNEGGTADPSAKLMSAIAYSALDEGELVFGNTGIRAMFDDLDELGYVYNPNFDSLRDPYLDSEFNDGWIFDTSLKQAITAIAVQYAGALALNKIEQDNQPQATKGVLALSEPKDILALDLCR